MAESVAGAVGVATAEGIGAAILVESVVESTLDAVTLDAVTLDAVTLEGTEVVLTVEH